MSKCFNGEFYCSGTIFKINPGEYKCEKCGIMFSRKIN